MLTPSSPPNTVEEDRPAGDDEYLDIHLEMKYDFVAGAKAYLICIYILIRLI